MVDLLIAVFPHLCAFAAGFGVFYLMRCLNIRKRRKATAAACEALAEKAIQRLYAFTPPSDSPLSTVEYEGIFKEALAAIEDALEKQRQGHLEAYANLIDRCPAILISMTVFFVEYMKVVRPDAPLKPSDLTVDMVIAYHELRSAADPSGDSFNDITSDACYVGYYAMEHMDDYPLILDTVNDRRITNVDDLEEALRVIKDNPSGALAGGTL